MARWVNILVLTLSGALAVDGCVTEPDFKGTFTPVDSGGGTFVPDLFTSFPYTGVFPKQSRLAWTNDGTTLMVAGEGPHLYTSTRESSLWSVAPSGPRASLRLTMAVSDAFAGAVCHEGTVGCDVLFQSGRALRRAPNGDTATVLLKSLNGHYTSANGRFIVFSEGNNVPFLIDATTGTRTQLNLPDPTRAVESAPRVAVSDDGTEIDVISTTERTVTRFRADGGPSSTWTIPDEPGFTYAYGRELRWVGTRLHALVEWQNATQSRFVQYVVGEAGSLHLGSMERSARFSPGVTVWRPAVRRLVVEFLSACDIDTKRDPYSSTCVERQFELYLVRGGVTTRVGRSRTGWLNMSLSPDGRSLAYGDYAIAIKALPE